MLLVSYSICMGIYKCSTRQECRVELNTWKSGPGYIVSGFPRKVAPICKCLLQRIKNSLHKFEKSSICVCMKTQKLTKIKLFTTITGIHFYRILKFCLHLSQPHVLQTHIVHQVAAPSSLLHAKCNWLRWYT